MGILPPLQATLHFFTFMARLMDLKEFNTVLVLHDRTYRDQINLLIVTLQPRYDVTWILVNKHDNYDYLENFIIGHEKTLILTALEHTNIFPALNILYLFKKINERSKNIIVSSDISKYLIETWSSFHLNPINSVLMDWTLAEPTIYALNPFSAEKFIKLNETEFFWASKPDVTNRNYSTLFFDQLQNVQGKTTYVYGMYESKNIYKVISKSSPPVSRIDGLEVRLIDMIGEAIQSPLELCIIKPNLSEMGYKTMLYRDYLNRTYKTFAPVPLRKYHDFTNMEAFRLVHIWSSGER